MRLSLGGGEPRQAKLLFVPLPPSSLKLLPLVLLRQPVFRPWQRLSLRSSYGLSGWLCVSGWDIQTINVTKSWLLWSKRGWIQNEDECVAAEMFHIVNYPLQACCATCSGLTRIRTSRAGERTTAASPLPLELMWSASSSIAMIWISSVEPTR